MSEREGLFTEEPPLPPLSPGTSIPDGSQTTETTDPTFQMETDSQAESQIGSKSQTQSEYSSKCSESNFESKEHH